MLVCVSQYAPQKMSANASPCLPTTFGVDILLLLLYSNKYKGIKSFVLVPWMQRQCPVDKVKTERWDKAEMKSRVGVEKNPAMEDYY